MKIVIVSDTHTMHNQLKVGSGDVLIHCGDFTNRGEHHYVQALDRWMGEQDFKHKLLIAGNHDMCFEDTPKRARALLKHVTYLEDSGVEIEGVKFWGSPWQPEFCNWGFNLPRNTGQLYSKWKQIPDDTNVLITHGPPAGILDTCGRIFGAVSVGCEELRRRVDMLDELRLHCFGHIHASYGSAEVDGKRFVNASSLDETYNGFNPPQVVEL